MRSTVPGVDCRQVEMPAGGASASRDQHEPSALREPPARVPAVIDGEADSTASLPHRRRTAVLIRRLVGRTEAELRRELDRFFAARPDLGTADRAQITRTMTRFRNQLLHLPRSGLRAAADDDPTLLDGVGRLYGLAEAPHDRHTGLCTLADRPTRSSTSSAVS